MIHPDHQNNPLAQLDTWTVAGLLGLLAGLWLFL